MSDARNGKIPIQLSPLVHLSNNWISLIGVVVVTTATVFWLFLLPTTMRGEIHNPYNGILAFMLLPALFFLGLILIPLGIYRQNRGERRRGLYPAAFPPLNLKNMEFRRLISFVGVTTFANIVIASQLAYGAVSYMETQSFCGQTCHTVMQPEYTAYQSSPHSRVECVQCHIGPGESWFVRSKLSGIRQVFAVMFHTYETPIPTPVHNLRPARETCEACHWPQKYGEDRLRIIDKFGDDENNSPTKTVLLMKIGGGNKGIGIHGTHLGPGVHIRYGHSDAQRQTIPWIEYGGPAGKTVYRAEGAAADGKGLSIREMDCIDCHNRPSHSYKLPERAVDEAMFAGDLSASLPFAKKKSVEILKVAYASREEAAARIPSALTAFYRDTYPAIYKERQAEVTKTGMSLLALYNRNVFPAMKIAWGTYPNNIGHSDFPGCFRCHDDSHASADGRKVTQDCGACHSLLAMEEPAPKILTDLGVVESKGQK
ncbi:MAG: NapC/NirT family cytochrome c [Bryobacteraceae bacterium]|jgi:nitrate/TMAO reductase-like tetraheme cytochrome c subunit